MRSVGLAFGVGLLMFSEILSRAAWGARPEPWTAVQFWVATLTFEFVLMALNWSRPSLRYGWLLVLLGGSSNALVTIANGGRMPVLGEAPSRDGASVWVAATDDHVLLWLCDRFWGFSVGDALIIVGGLVMLFAPVTVWAVHQLRRRQPALVIRQGGFPS